MANLNFDATQVDPNNNYEAIPAGEYPAVIVSSEAKQAKSGRGQYLNLELEVVDGEFRGRKLWDILNLWHDNATARDIAQRTLSQICHAVGVLQPRDSSELHGKPMIAIVRVEDDANYGKRNVIKGYKAMAQSAPQPTPQPHTAPQQPQGASVPPWQTAPAGA